MTGRPDLVLLLVVFLLVVAEELGAQGGLLLLTGVDEVDLGADLGREQGDHVVGQWLGRCDHLTLEEQEADDVASGPVEPGAELLGCGTPLHDHLVVGHRRARRQVRGDLDRLELLHVATTATRPALGWAPSPDGAASGSAGRTTRGVATAA